MIVMMNVRGEETANALSLFGGDDDDDGGEEASRKAILKFLPALLSQLSTGPPTAFAIYLTTNHIFRFAKLAA
jgi:hypothetical protein